jgi:hypothetical protein
MENYQSLGSRATTVEELETILYKFFDEDSKRRGLAFQPHSSDIIISPYAKSGTTWLQQIAHGLRTRGSMDFDEINAVTPWIEIAYDVGWDLEAPQVAEPRVFKSHLTWHDVPKGGRYICSFRRPQEAFVSYYRFFEGWYIEPGAISMETLFDWRWPRDELDRQGYWYHLRSWWDQRQNPSVLLLCYEDMRADLPGTVRKIAQFMDIPLDEELLDIVIRQSSRDFMLAHKDQFNEAHIREIGGKRAGLPRPIDSSKVTAGPTNNARYRLSPELNETLDDIWREQIGARYGLDTYDDLRREVSLGDFLSVPPFH